jgi:hypothetical protein
LNNLGFYTEVDALYYYSSVTRKFKEMGSSDYFEPGRGYYIHVKTDCIWEVPLAVGDPI